MTGEEIVRKYNEDGWVVIPNVIDQNLVKETQGHIEWLGRQYPEIRPEQYHHQLIVDDPFWIRLCTDARLIDVIEPFLGPNIALFAAGFAVDLIPGRALAEGLLEEFPPPDGGGRILLARAEVARDVLPDGLRAAGWDVDIVVAYRNVEPDNDLDPLAAAREADAVVFTAESTVHRYTALAGGSTPADAVCIGPVSAEAARELGYRVVEADPHSVEGLVAAACAWASR